MPRRIPERKKPKGPDPPPDGLHWIAVHYRVADGRTLTLCRAWSRIGEAVIEAPALIAMGVRGPFTILDIRESPVGPDAWDLLNRAARPP